MSKIKVTFLGTGTSQGVPLIGCRCEVCSSSDRHDKRLRSSVLISSSATTVVIDGGPDFRQQMLREKVRKLDAMLLTHEHKDHIAGIDDVRAFNFLTGKPFDIYATKRVQKALHREFAYVFNEDNYPGIPKINLKTIGTEPFTVGDLEIIPVEVLHFNLPVLGFRVGGFTYITDAHLIPEKEKKKITGSKVLVLNVLRREPHVSHFTMEKAVEIMKEFKPELGYFTHISHQLGKHKDVNAELPESIRCAYDGLTITVD